MLFVHEGVFDEEEFSTERERRLAALLANEVTHLSINFNLMLRSSNPRIIGLNMDSNKHKLKLI